MIELHNKKAIWEVTITGTISESSRNIEATYFEAIQLSAHINLDKKIELTTAKVLVKKYTASFRQNKKNTAKSKALSEKITELKSFNQDEVLVQLAGNTYQTLEQFYTSTLFKSLERTVKEMNQIHLLNQIREEISTQTNHAITKEELTEIIIQTQAKQKEQEKGIGYTIAKQVITILGTSILLIILAFNADTYLKDMITRYINDDPISQNANYKLCMAEKNDVPNCTQYVEVIGRHSHTLDIAETREQRIHVINKVKVLQLATTTFNTKIYNDIETCSARNLPDTRSMTGRILGEPTLLFRCQSSEIMNIKRQSLLLEDFNHSTIASEVGTPETKTETKKVSHQEAAMNFLVILLSFALLFITILGNDNKKKKK